MYVAPPREAVQVGPKPMITMLVPVVLRVRGSVEAVTVGIPLHAQNLMRLALHQ